MNHLKEIAIVGASGTIGSHIVSALLAKKNFNITAISHTDSKGIFPPGVIRSNVDYNDPSTLISVLCGKDALIITMAVTAAKDTSTKLIRAAATAGVPWILPNEFGMYNTEEAQNDTVGDGKTKDRRLIEELGMSWIGLTCGFWYEHSLSNPELYGFDIAKRQATFFDDGLQKLNMSTYKQVGRSVASILALPLQTENGDDKASALEFYRNRMTFVSSFAVSQRDMLDSLQRVTGTVDGEWKIEQVEAKKRFDEAKEKMKSGNRAAFGRALYTRYFYGDAGLFEKSHRLDNERLGLPAEDLDGATERAVKLQESGYWASYGKH
jgi:hypothetical protein